MKPTDVNKLTTKMTKSHTGKSFLARGKGNLANVSTVRQFDFNKRQIERLMETAGIMRKSKGSVLAMRHHMNNMLKKISRRIKLHLTCAKSRLIKERDMDMVLTKLGCQVYGGGVPYAPKHRRPNAKAEADE